MELFPKSDEDVVQLKVELPAGTKLDITKNVIEQFEQIIKSEIKGYKGIITMIGERSFYGFLGSAQSNKGSIMITLKDKKLEIESI